MPLNLRQLRVWLVISGVLLIAVVACFIAYGRYRTRQIVRSLPEKLGANIQQTAQGFTYSQSAGGRTLFTIHASQMVQFRGGGKAELKDVNIIVYGRDSSRFDQIYGSGFEYDPQQKIVRAIGEVHIDLQADAEGVKHPDQAPPQELKNPVHVKTSGLSFNEKTGIAETEGMVEFRTPQASGSAQGAVYDSGQRTLTLKHDVHLLTQAAALSNASLTRNAAKSKPNKAAQASGPAEIRASSAVLRNETRTATLENVVATRGSETIRAQTAVIALRDDSTVQRVVAVGEVQGNDSGKSAASFKASKLELLFNESSEINTAELSGGATYEVRGMHPMRGSAGRVLASFGEGNTLEKVRAVDNVDMVEEPSLSAAADRAKNADPAGGVQRVEIKAPAVEVFTREGRNIERADATGASQILLTQAADGQSPNKAGGLTTISATQFTASFDEQNHLRTVHGASEPNAEPVKIVSSTPGQPDRITTSRKLDAAFAPGGNAINSLVQSGDFHYTEGSRGATADEARFVAAINELALTGSPRYSDEQVQLSSDSLVLNRGTGEIKAAGEVKTTYLPQNTPAAKPTNSAMFSSVAPAHVTSRDMVAQRSSGTAIFSGGSRLWQGADLVEAPTIKFDRDRRAVEAQGSEAQPVRSVFVQTGQNGRSVPVNVASARLAYSGTDNQAHFTGGITVRSSDTTLTADHADVLLRQPNGAGQLSGQTGNGAEQVVSGPAQVERIIAQGNVTIVQPGRKAKGQQLVYVAADQSFTLTGGPPSIFDAERGQITGNSLTFYAQGDRVLVENPANGGKKTVIHTRVTK